MMSKFVHVVGVDDPPGVVDVQLERSIGCPELGEVAAVVIAAKLDEDRVGLSDAVKMNRRQRR